jgi:hypothetical protein
MIGAMIVTLGQPSPDFKDHVCLLSNLSAFSSLHDRCDSYSGDTGREPGPGLPSRLYGTTRYQLSFASGVRSV